MLLGVTGLPCVGCIEHSQFISRHFGVEVGLKDAFALSGALENSEKLMLVHINASVNAIWVLLARWNGFS